MAPVNRRYFVRAAALGVAGAVMLGTTPAPPPQAYDEVLGLIRSLQASYEAATQKGGRFWGIDENGLIYTF